MSYAWVCVHIFICVNVGTCAPCVCMGVRGEPWLSFVTFYLCCFAVEPGRLAGWPENFQGCSRPVVHLLRMVLSWKGRSPFCLPGLLHRVWGRELWANAFILSYLLSPAPALEISFLKENLSFIYYDYFVSTWASVCVHMYHNMYGIRGWLSGIGSCFHCRLQGLNSYHQGHLQTLSPAEPSW